MGAEEAVLMSTYPPVPTVEQTAQHIMAVLRASVRREEPYRHWLLKDVLPIDICTGILTLPIAPVDLGRTDGTRGSYNGERCFFTPAMRQRFPTISVLCDAMQRPDVAKLMAQTCEFDITGSNLRMEYIQDVDGAWLEPHHDIPQKLFSMVIYLFTGPDTAEWGTDIYDSNLKWVGRSKGDFNSATIFIPGENTWHGFEPRKIIGVRRLMEINYVRSDFFSRDQLAFPDQPLKTS
jgi:hypothetical protein